MIHTPRKRFGQNFLQDSSVIERIIAAIHPKPEDNLIEIGSGLGALTIPMLKLLGKLKAIEIDRDICQTLIDKTRNFGQLEIYQQDALKFDFNTLYQDKPLRIFGNLPYNISTPLLFHLLTFSSFIQDMHFMLQKEVVERICAKPNTEHYGRLSVMMQYYTYPEYLFTVAPDAFYPQPKVESAIVCLSIPKQPPVNIDNTEDFTIIVQACFQQRRKTLRNTLKGFLTAQEIEEAGIDSSLRAEVLTLEHFAQLTNFYTKNKR